MPKTMMLSLLSGLFGAVFFVTLNEYINHRSLAAVRLDEIMAKHMKVVGDMHLSDTDRELASAHFAKQLKLALAQVSQDKRVTLLVAPAVLSDIPDYTDDVFEQISGLEK